MDTIAFAALIKRKRGELKWSQQVLATKIWGDPGRKGDISRLENAKTLNPHEQTVQYLCEALKISPAELEPIRQSRLSAAQLDHIPTLSREDLQNLAARFDIPGAFDLSDEALRTLLTQKAEEYRSYKSLIDGLDDRVAAIANLKGAAQDAANTLNFDEVETLLARVDEVETTIAAETKEARAANALLSNKPDQAYAIYGSAADAFRELDITEYARRRNTYRSKLYNHGLRYGGPGLALAADIIRPAIVALASSAHQTDWAGYSQNLAIALQTQGSRTEGSEGAVLLTEAVTAYHAALTVYTRTDHPVQWAETQANLAIAHLSIARHDTCTDPRPPLDAALSHVDAALTIFDPDHLPYNHQKTTRLRDHILTAREDLPNP